MIIIGLDNGIQIRGRSNQGIDFLRNYCSYMEDEYASTPDTYELVYWRKCWNMRARFNEVIGFENQGETLLTLDDLSIFVEKVLKFFLIEENWEETGNSIWEWDIMIRNIGDQIYNVRRFLDEIKAYNEEAEEPLTDADFLITFYDSY